MESDLRRIKKNKIIKKELKMDFLCFFFFPKCCMKYSSVVEWYLTFNLISTG